MKSTAQDITTELASAAPRAAGWQVAASAAILFHLLAVWIAPFSVPPASPLAQTVANGFRPYLEAAFLNHGYKFFAPDPGPTHLVRYELKFADGRTQGGIFPNLKEQWPRLLYHRHMMLSERLEGPPQAYWIGAFSRSYAQHLLSEHPEATSVALHLVTHDLPSPPQVLSGMKLSDPSLYRQRQLLVLRRDEL